MLVNAITIAVSCILLVYWFRYACVLILSAESARDYASPIARANGLLFPEARQQLSTAPAERPSLDAIRAALDQDYRVLTWLMRHATEFQKAGRQLEQRMLALDYHILRIAYPCARRLSARRCRLVLEEMGGIVRHYASMMGECSATSEAA